LSKIVNCFDERSNSIKLLIVEVTVMEDIKI
jgi:hypothetical protein